MSITLIADRIDRVLETSASGVFRQDHTTQDFIDHDWISDRYQQLRIEHQQGFSGAIRQARTEWIVRVLSEEMP